MGDRLVPRPTGGPVRLAHVPAQESGRGVRLVVNVGRRSFAGFINLNGAPCHALPGRGSEEGGVNQAYDLAWFKAGWRRDSGDSRPRRSNKRMQQTRGGWRRVAASWSATPRSAVIAGQGKVVRPSQLIRSVRQTVRVRARGKTSQMADRILAGLLSLLVCTTACVGLRPRTTLEGRPFDVANVQSIHPGLTEPDVRALLGEPYEATVDGEHTVWRYYERFTPRGCDANPPTIAQEFRVRFAAGHVVSTEGASPREKR